MCKNKIRDLELIEITKLKLNILKNKVEITKKNNIHLREDIITISKELNKLENKEIEDSKKEEIHKFMNDLIVTLEDKEVENLSTIEEYIFNTNDFLDFINKNYNENKDKNILLKIVLIEIKTKELEEISDYFLTKDIEYRETLLQMEDFVIDCNKELTK